MTTMTTGTAMPNMIDIDPMRTWPVPRAEPRVDAASGIYFALTGRHPADARVELDQDFDRHALACGLSVGAADGSFGEGAGLDGDELNELVARWFPEAAQEFVRWPHSARAPDDDEATMVRDLLLANRSTAGDEGRWLAFMVARRAMEPNHLWEDLGLRDRSEISRLLVRHFAPLAARNTRNMRWKRFFYRTLCESDGLVMCSTPVCSSCGDFDLCFGEESGESRLAYTRRRLALKAAAA